MFGEGSALLAVAAAFSWSCSGIVDYLVWYMCMESSPNTEHGCGWSITDLCQSNGGQAEEVQFQFSRSN